MGQYLELAFGVYNRNNIVKYGKEVLKYLQEEQEIT